jgi:hypothetical protein
MLFTVYVRSKTKNKTIKTQKLEWHFLRIKDALHYAIDNFDLKNDVGMTVMKDNKVVITLGRE